MSLHIRSRIRFGIGASPSEATSGYTDTYNSYDFAVGGIPFLSAMSRDTPAIIKSADFRKNQIDQSVEPGEQSLTGWWVRSQLSFHGGAGLQFSDPSLDESAPIRFKESEGVDVWTQGQVTLLNQVDLVKAQNDASPSLMVGGDLLGTDCVVYACGTEAGYILADGTTAVLTPTGGPTLPWQSIASDGGCYYVANGEGVWQVTFTGTGPITYTFDKLWTIPSNDDVAIGWAKGRLMLGWGADIYELIDPGGGGPHALPTAAFTAEAVGWIWSSFTSGPEAIYAAGYSGNRGTIMRILVDNEGALPVLTGATEVAALPTGEYPLCIRTYLGTKMGIGTNLGFRVAEIDSAGSLAYGPLIPSDGNVNDMVGRDRFIYYTDGDEGNSGLVRVDLSVLNPSGRYAFATDLKLSGHHEPNAVAIIGKSDRLALSNRSLGIYFESATDLVDDGYLLTAQTRYNTLWPKLFKRLSVRARILGHLVVSTVDKNSNEVTVATLDDNSDLGPDLVINAPDSPQESLGLRFTLEQLDATTGPTFRGYQFKALPGGPRQYTYVMPMLCFDSEKDGQGNVMGNKGYGSERLVAIQELASEGTVVLFEDLSSGFSVLVTIEEIEFVQMSPGGMTQSPWGGVLTLSMRTLD